MDLDLEGGLRVVFVKHFPVISEVAPPLRQPCVLLPFVHGLALSGGHVCGGGRQFFLRDQKILELLIVKNHEPPGLGEI